MEYLLDLISPPGQRAIYWDSLDINWSGFEDNSLCGVIVRGTPTDDESAQILRILKPGAHLLLIAPDEEPTGHTGACHVEDAGFEIRDAILWVRESGRTHYVPKASRSEREAGCSHLKGHIEDDPEMRVKMHLSPDDEVCVRERLLEFGVEVGHIESLFE